MDLSDLFLLNAIFQRLFVLINTSNSSVPITAILGTRTIVLGYFNPKFAFLSKLLAKAKPLALPPSDPVDILTKLNSFIVVFGSN